MAYTLGISSGMYGIKKEEDYLGIARKIQWSITKGVKFSQIDLESITEFLEPDLENKVKRIKALGVEFGFHGESQAMGGRDTPVKLDSAIAVDYERTHERLMIALENAGKLGSKYFLLHSSETQPFILLGKDLQPSKVVDFWGRPLKKIIEEDKRLKDWILENDYIWEFSRETPKKLINTYVNQMKERFYIELQRKGKEIKEPDKKELKKIEEDAKEYTISSFLQETSAPHLSYGVEAATYYIIAKWMELNKDSLWKSIANNGKIDDDKFRKSWEKWVPAVSAKYIWGHFNPKSSDYKDPKTILEKYKMYFVLETPTGFAGGENLGRFSRPLHMAYLSEHVGTSYFGVAFDFEHVLGNNIDPKKEIAEFSAKGGKWIKVLHLGFPTPLHTAHAKIDIGSDEQKYLYDRIWELKQKGFDDGYLIFERGGGEDPVGQTILALRLVKKYLEMNTHPKDLPLEFYGLKQEGPAVKAQQLQIKEHTLDPLKGMLVVPEEEHGILSGAAQRKGKTKEWEAEKYR